jgi:hypothetical protein
MLMYDLCDIYVVLEIHILHGYQKINVQEQVLYVYDKTILYIVIDHEY